MVTPNGQTKEILGRQCQGYTVEVTIPMTHGRRDDGHEDVRTGLDREGRRRGGGVQGSAEGVLGRRDVDVGSGSGASGHGDGGADQGAAEAGVVMEQENQMTMEGTGQMAQMMARWAA